MFKDMHYEKRLNAMVEASGYIYSIGGIGRENKFEDTKVNIKQENTVPDDPREVALSLVEKYDKESDEWSIMPPMRKSRIAPAVASYNGRIYVLGGGGVDGESLRLPVNHGDRLFRRSVEFFDIYTNEWVLAKKGMASPRIKFRACVFDDKIYAVGGNKDSNNNVEQANIQDIRGEGDVVGQGAEVWNVAEWIGEMSEWNYMATLLMNVPTEQMQVD
uniref:influenza virus NS1A-binding protein-like isoform X2 n=1 Tax=Styela clava TaxID=7725 RepID=UPI0019398C0B|nr:influenza virus NS1A-binding protein-like isoform X2 [Styela clava]